MYRPIPGSDDTAHPMIPALTAEVPSAIAATLKRPALCSEAAIAFSSSIEVTTA